MGFDCPEQSNLRAPPWPGGSIKLSPGDLVLLEAALEKRWCLVQVGWDGVVGGGMLPCWVAGSQTFGGRQLLLCPEMMLL